MVAAAGIPILDAPFVSVGGGIGSFVWSTCSASPACRRQSITVLTNIESPGRPTST